MRRIAPFVLAALLAAPAPAAARIRVVDLHSGAVNTVASGPAVRPLGWRAGAVLGFDGTAVRRYPGARTVLRWRGAYYVVLGGNRLAAVAGGGEHSDRVVVRGLDGRRLAAHTFSGFVDSLAWSPRATCLAVGWTDHALHSHLTILTPRLRPLRTVDSPAPVTMSAGGWAPDGRTLVYVASQPRRGVEYDRLPSQVRALDIVRGRQTVLLRGTRCDGFACELLEAPQAAGGGRVAFVRNLNGVTLLRPGARPRALALPSDCDGVDAVAWAGASLAVAYTSGGTGRLALLPQQRTIATLGPGEADGVLVSGRRAAVYQR